MRIPHRRSKYFRDCCGKPTDAAFAGYIWLHVLHDTGIYDTDRDHAYNVAAPVIQKILQDHPSIEVVIDLHRDGVADTTRLAANINGVDMAQVMFFNGLSKTTATGDIDYLRNLYRRQSGNVSENAACRHRTVSGFTRKIYLKSYRYNMHLCPKSLLIEVGAQTNTLQEAVNCHGSAGTGAGSGAEWEIVKE